MKTFATAVSQPGPSVMEEDIPSQLLCALIAGQPFFKGLSSEYLQLLADSAIEMKFAPGQAIFDAEGPDDRFYLILEGEVSLESETKEHGSITIQTLGPGDDLGWAWLFPPYALHFSAHALVPTRTIFFYRSRLREQCEQDHELGYQLMKRTAEAATQCLRAVQQRLLEYASPQKLQL